MFARNLGTGEPITTGTRMQAADQTEAIIITNLF